MGTKKPSFMDTLSSTNMPDHKLQPVERIHRDPSPRPAISTHGVEENRRMGSDTVKTRDKTRHREMETLERHHEKDRAPAPRLREGEREWRERERRQDDRSRNGRLQSNLEESDRHAERRMKKGDTFPRMRKGGADHERRMISTKEVGNERGDRRERDRPRRVEADKWEHERERTWHRERERGETRSKNHQGRPVNDQRLLQREKYQDPDVFHDRRREPLDKRDIGERDTLRKRDQLRANMSDREARIPSPYRRERDIYVDRRDREKAQRREGKRDTRSEGDSDERELRKERVRNRERDELIYQQSKSEGDTQGKSARDRDQDRREDRPRNKDREGDQSMRKGVEKDRYRENNRRAVRPVDREGERWSERDYKHDKREDDRHRRDRERREREANHKRRDDAAGRSSQSPNESTSMEPMRGQSSGEWSSDMDSDTRYQRDRDSYEERAGRRYREEERGAERGQRLRISSEKQDSDRGGGSEQEQRRMWLEPRMEKNSKEELVDRERRKESRKEEESVEQEPKEESGERFLDQNLFREKQGDWSSYGDIVKETQEVSVDEEELGEIWKGSDSRGREHLSDSDGGIEGSWRWDAEGENMTDNTEESDREEEGGIDDWARSESEGGSEAGWKQDRERMLSGEDGFLTVSSGGDEDYERETDEDEFKDCQEFLEGGSPYEHRSPVGFMGQEEDEREEQWTMKGEEKVEEEGMEKQPKVVFCVIGQTLPCSAAEERQNTDSDVHRPCTDGVQLSKDDLHLNRSGESPVTEREKKQLPVEELAEMTIRHRASSDLQETHAGKEMRSQVDHADFGSLKRDSQTERLLKEWREKNKELGHTSPLPNNPYPEVGSPLNFEQIQPLLDQLTSGAMSPEEVEAIRIRMSGAWSMSEEPKRHSQAPHLKWAKNVVREILGHSDEQIADGTNAAPQEDQGINQKKEEQDEAVQGTEEMPIFKVTSDEQPSEPELEEDELLEGLRDYEDDRSKSWGEVELRNVLETINRRNRNSRFFKTDAAQLYQQYSEEAQNFEILRQSRSDVLSVCEDTSASPAPSPPPARRPLPPLPPVPHPHSLTHTGSITSVKSLPLPEPPRSGSRSHSPRPSISLSQSPSLWRDLPAVRNSTELDDLTEDQRRLQEVRFEVVTSEASYCRSLDIVVEHFVMSKQLGSLLTTQDRNWLFSRLADVRAISHSFLTKLEERVDSDMMHFAVCDIIARHCQRFKMVYVPYLTNQSYQDATYQRLWNENPGFKRVVEKIERSPVCQRLPLRSFLVLPFQRITRIKLLVQNIVKRTTPGTPEATHAIKALKLLEKLIQESNDSITQMKSIESLVSLSAKVDFDCKTLPLISPSRRLVREGPVTELMDFSLKDTERSIYMHLFNDYLLLSLQKEGGRFTVIDHSPVSELRAENCRVKLHSLQKNLFRLHKSKKSLLLRTDTQSDKLRWISALSRPHPEIDFSAAQDFEQMQCHRSFVAQQPDELSLEKADVILVHQQSSDNWVEGTRLSDRHRGWIPTSHLETISSSRVRQHNLSDALKLTTATAAI